jgi:DNA polymerase
VTEAERRIALEQIANEVRACTRCRLHEQRTRAVPGEGNPATEVVLVGEGPGFNEDREGRPFVGRAGALLVRLLASIGWRRDDVFITNVVKCRPPDNRDPQPDEIAACAPFLRRQLAVLDPSLVVTLGRYSMGTFMPGARISQAHGTMKPASPETGAHGALAFAMYHPAAALRTPEIERQSFADIATVPAALVAARERRERHARESSAAPLEPTSQSEPISQEALPRGVPAFETPAPAATAPGSRSEAASGLTASVPTAVAAHATPPGNASYDIPARAAPTSTMAPEPMLPPAADPEPAADQLTLF